MAILTNYTIQCRDVASGQTGCFLFDTDHWQKTGEFKAISRVFAGLIEFYANTHPDDRKAVYLERATGA
jgi:hypothetical protein